LQAAKGTPGRLTAGQYCYRLSADGYSQPRNILASFAPAFRQLGEASHHHPSKHSQAREDISHRMPLLLMLEECLKAEPKVGSKPAAQVVGMA
jgi:hypothetical protein